MIKYARYSVVLFLLFTGLTAWAASLDGKVLGTDKTPVEGAIVSAVVEGEDFSAISGADGAYSLDLPSGKGYVRFVAEGYYQQEYPLNEKLDYDEIILVPLISPHYSGAAHFPNYSLRRDNKSISTQSVEKKDFSKHFSIDQAIQDKVPGLYINRKSGMPGEGAYLNLRGIHSVVAENMPLIVINGIPSLGNQELSGTVRAYSRNTLFGYSTDDIRSITLLKGADASVYGSLGSNGVILIETEQATSDNLETRISFSGQYGLSRPGRSLPVLDVSQYKNYLREIGMTRYNMITALYTDYPFLQNEDNYYSYLFNNTTDWRGLVQDRAFITDNTFRVEGGDEIAKYNISFGYTSEGGVLGQTSSDRYHTLINSNIMVSRNVDIFTNVGLAYINSSLQEQGMNAPTNAILSSYFALPLLSPNMKEPNGNILDRYATYNGWNVNSNPTFPYDNVSNPLAIVNTVNASDKIYDANIRLGLNYRANSYLSFTGMLNIYYNYTEESIFIPGVTDKAIIPQYYSSGLNTVRKGIIENATDYYGLSAIYRRTFQDIHQLNADAGLRYVGRKLEYDLASGYNTANDYYETLGAVIDDRDIQGGNQEWKWLNYHLHADYIYD
ncbi:MAG: TonB-dependent receptor plug domain-containing protein, partial [Bacteroidales bacterium]